MQFKNAYKCIKNQMQMQMQMLLPIPCYSVYIRQFLKWSHLYYVVADFLRTL